MTIVTKSKGMQKSPDFHALYGSIVTKSKGMQKISRISRNIWPYSYQIKRYAKKSSFSRKLKHPNSKCSKLYFYSKRFRFAPSFNYWSFYPSEPIQKARFNMRHPVVDWEYPWKWKETRLLWHVLPATLMVKRLVSDVSLGNIH